MDERGFVRLPEGTIIERARRMRWSPLVALLLAGACTPRAVTPPGRTFVMDSPITPAPGKSDLQLDVASIGEIIWGPELTAGGGRIRHSVDRQLAIEVDTGILHVANPGSGGNRNAYTGRVGVIRASADQRVALGAGLGGGHSSVAGSWGSVDIGGWITGKHRWIRPVLGAAVGYSAPFSRTPFTVTHGDNETTTLQLPANVYGQAHFGLELGPPDSMVVIGASFARFGLLESSVVGEDDLEGRDQLYGALGLGARFQLD